MPWETPTLEALRTTNRDNVVSRLRSGPMVPNSVARVMSDANAGLGYLNLLYIDWLAKQLMPDTAEKEWLDRFGDIWLGGRKTATFGSGAALATGFSGLAIPDGTLLSSSENVVFQTKGLVSIGPAGSPLSIVCLSPGETDLQVGASLSPVSAIAGLSGITVTSFSDGINEENDEDLRGRVLSRIRQPPMGGDKEDYIQWAEEVPGVTRAWSFPLEMGIGTVTLRFMMDDFRSDQGGFPTQSDIDGVSQYLDIKRPVAVKDFFVEAPIPQEIEMTIRNLDLDDGAVRAAIESSVNSLLMEKATPGQTIYRNWVSLAISNAPGVDHFDLDFDDAVMPSPGHLAVLGTIIYG